ncbi:MAG: DUF805 domain-containing protein [Paludibacteraceae bacterium]|nr:DUF805 domain-containing protein [Paludibacteraceae bacterium]MBO6235187.1 DUF805 domain-containing protein [Schwartzia sp. (in: firmicutes)]
MSFTEAITTCSIKKFATISGRATRAEFWWFVLFCFLTRVVLAICLYFLIIDLPASSQGFFSPYFAFFLKLFLIILSLLIMFVVLVIPEFCVTIRRLHDVGYDGSQFLVKAIPIAGIIWLIKDLCQPSDPNDNAFGPNPFTIPQTSN